MDSFYDVPRRPPLLNVSERIVAAPVVPEISVLCPSNEAAVANRYTSYGQWKMSQNQNQRGFNIGNKENFSHSGQNISYLKKQVRFESPVLQQRPNLTYEPVLPKSGAVLKANTANHCGPRPAFLSQKDVNKKPPSFEQMYLANIPNRHLDLSIIDLLPHKSAPEAPVIEENAEPVPKKIETASTFPQTYKDYRKLCDEIKTVDTVTDIFNYKRPDINKKDSFPIDVNKDYRAEPLSTGVTPCSSIESVDLDKNHIDIPYTKQFSLPNHDFYNQTQPLESKKQCHCDCTTQTSAVMVSQQNSTDEPTVKDLLKIISQQNEQLLLLQKQVATLISRDQGNNQKNQIENGVQTSTHHEPQKNNRGVLPKFSIDLMTSFEVSFKRQTNMYQNKDHLMGQHQQQMQEVTETETCTSRNGARCETNRTMVDTSLFLQEPLDIRETCPSPEPSIKININDYEDSDDENDDELSNSEIEASFYNNLMQQVDKILRKAQIQTNEELLQNCQNNMGTDQKNYGTERFVKDRTMNKVKEATFKHLQSIGVNVENFSDSSNSPSCSEATKNYNATEISFAVKQLLLKYLPDEHLAKIRHKPQLQSNEAPKINRRDKSSGIIQNRPEFSFATVQYMKKYNLIATNNKDPREINNRGSRPQHSESPKILDISKLKQQPKLL